MRNRLQAFLRDRLSRDLTDSVRLIGDTREGTIQIADVTLLPGYHEIELLALHRVCTGIRHVVAVGRIIFSLLPRIGELSSQ